MNLVTATSLERGLGIYGRLRGAFVAAGTLALIVTCAIDGNFSPAAWALGCWGCGRALIAWSLSGVDRADAESLFDSLFFISILLICLFYHYYNLIYRVPYESGGTDDERYERLANALIGAGTVNIQELQDEVSSSRGGSWNPNANYIIIIAAVHGLTKWIGAQIHTINPRIINAMFLGLGGAVIMCIGLRCGLDRAHAKLAALTWGLMPGILFCSAHIYRDVMVGFGLSAMMLGCLLLFQDSASGRERAAGMGLVVPGALFSVTMREGLPIAGLGVCILVITAMRGWWKRLALLVVFFGFLGFAVGGISIIGDVATRVGDVYLYYSELRRGNGAEDGLGTGIFALPWFLSLPLRLLYLSISPIPFPAETATENFRRLGTLVWFGMLPFLYQGARKALREFLDFGRSVFAGVFLAFSSFYVLVAWLTMQDRHLTMYLPFAGIMVAKHLQERRSPVGPAILNMALGGGIMLIAYLVIKLVK